jgi:hypothetical protein
MLLNLYLSLGLGLKISFNYAEEYLIIDFCDEELWVQIVNILIYYYVA